MSLLCPNYVPCGSVCSPCVPCGPTGPCANSCCPPRPCKSRELRGGVLIPGCHCTKRNGLQDNCPRWECQGRACCVTKPLPNCCPSKYMWRFQYRLMGKPTNPPAPCTINPISGSGCNPCVVACTGAKPRCPPCPNPPCPSMPCGGGPCTACGPCDPCCPSLECTPMPAGYPCFGC